MVTPEKNELGECQPKAPDLAGMSHTEANFRLADFFAKIHQQRMTALKASVLPTASLSTQGEPNT